MLRSVFERRLSGQEVLSYHRSLEVFLTYMRLAIHGCFIYLWRGGIFELKLMIEYLFKIKGCAYIARSCMRLRPMRSQSRSVEDGFETNKSQSLRLTSDNFPLYMPFVVRMFDVSSPCKSCAPGSNHKHGSDAEDGPLVLDINSPFVIWCVRMIVKSS